MNGIHSLFSLSPSWSSSSSAASLVSVLSLAIWGWDRRQRMHIGQYNSLANVQSNQHNGEGPKGRGFVKNCKDKMKGNFGSDLLSPSSLTHQVCIHCAIFKVCWVKGEMMDPSSDLQRHDPPIGRSPNAFQTDDSHGNEILQTLWNISWHKHYPKTLWYHANVIKPLLWSVPDV